jgi:DNA-binding SARP family transcriptional activator/tetratricopeptide (TPR) repeat protein
MRLNLLGGLKLVDQHNETVSFPHKRGQALLAYLAMKDGRAESREFIVDLLWPDRFKKQAQASLRQSVFELRRIQTSEPIIEADRNDVALGSGIRECDVWTFGECAASDHIDDAGHALKLYRGPFLDGPPLGPEPFRLWAAIQRARIEGKLDRSVLATTGDWEAQNTKERALVLLEELLRASPMCVPAMLRIMEIEAADDNVAMALRKCQRYMRRLKIEFEEEPPAELRDAYEVLKAMPIRHARFPQPRRRPAEAQSDPWRKTSIDAPVVAVLPFRYLGNSDDAAAMTAAIGEDVTMMLSGCRWFSVLSRSATHSFASEGLFVPKDFVNRTGADYLVYGAVVERPPNWSVTVELADAESGLITWARRYDTTADGLMRSPQELCPLIAAALDPAIAESEQTALSRPSLAATGSVAAYRHLVFGYRHYYGGHWRKAFEAFRRATGEDATYAHAYAMMALSAYCIAQIGRKDDWRDEMKSAEKLSRRAIEIDPSEAKGSIVLGQALDWQAQHDEATQHLERAARRNPSFAGASTARAYHCVMTGAFAEATDLMQTAIRLRVGDNGLGLCLPAKALAELHTEDIESALQTAHWAARLKPDFWLVRQVLAAALLAAGEKEAARDAVARMCQDYEGLSGEEFAAWFPYSSTDIPSPIADTFSHFGWQ